MTAKRRPATGKDFPKIKVEVLREVGQVEISSARQLNDEAKI